MSETFDMDKLTLEYFTNKQTYRKYLAKKDPTATTKKLYREISENQDHLVKIFTEMLNNTNSETYSLLQPKFENFIEGCLQHLEHSHMDSDNETETENEDYRKNRNSYGEKEQEQEEITLFERCDNTPVVPSNPIEYWKMQKVFKNPSG